MHLKNNSKLQKMGFLTTITIYNDGADQLQKHPKELAEILYKACSGIQKDSGIDSEGLGNHSNLITLQKPRHADDNTLYLHAGNTLIDVFETNSEWVIDTFIHEMKYHLKRLKKLRKG